MLGYCLLQLREVESKLERKNEENDLLREKHMEAEHRNFSQIRRLNTQLADVRNRANEEKQTILARLDEIEV